MYKALCTPWKRRYTNVIMYVCNRRNMLYIKSESNSEISQMTYRGLNLDKCFIFSAS